QAYTSDIIILIFSLFMKPPFDDLEKVTELIRLRTQEKKSIADLMKHFKCSYGKIVETLRVYAVQKKSLYTNMIQSDITPKKGKYDHLFEEPVATGKFYKDYLR